VARDLEVVRRCGVEDLAILLDDLAVELDRAAAGDRAVVELDLVVGAVQGDAPGVVSFTHAAWLPRRADRHAMATV
jgi:hypothetical protein